MIRACHYTPSHYTTYDQRLPIMAQFAHTTCLAQVKEGREGSDEDADEVTGGIKRSSSDKKRKGDVSHLHPSLFFLVWNFHACCIASSLWQYPQSVTEVHVATIPITRALQPAVIVLCKTEE